MVLPADGHVHSEWSWDAASGSMRRTCARAVELGLPAVAFTEHADYTPWFVRPGELDDRLQRFVAPDSTVVAPELNLDGYRESLQRCRAEFPGLRIISGVELGEPHRHPEIVARLLAAGEFDRVLASVHALPLGDRMAEPPNLFRESPPAEVIRDYLSEIDRLISASDAFAVLAHIDYPLRYWPTAAGPFDPNAFEDDFRRPLRTLAGSGRALEVNTAGPLLPEIVRWWRAEGGDAVTFGSDAHEPAELGRRFAEAAAMVEAHGFRPGRHPHDVWTAS